MPPENEQSGEIDLPFGVKLKGAAIRSFVPLLGWVAALATGYYFVSGPVTAQITSLTVKAEKVQSDVTEAREDIKELQRDVRRLYRLQSRAITDANGTEVSAVSRPRAIEVQ